MLYPIPGKFVDIFFVCSQPPACFLPVALIAACYCKLFLLTVPDIVCNKCAKSAQEFVDKTN